MTTEVQDAVRRVKELLLRDGWGQGRSIDNAGRRCLGGAANDIAASGTGLGQTLVAALNDECGRRLGFLPDGEPLCNYIVAWNDRSFRTFDEVIGLLDDLLAETARRELVEVVAI